MPRTTKVTILSVLPTLAIALVGLARTVSEPVAEVALLALAALALVGLLIVAVWRSDAAVLDDLLRSGNEARQEIIDRRLDEAAANEIYEAWYDDALARVAARLPAYRDDFIVAEEPVPENYSGQVTVIRRLVAQLGVLKEARKPMG